MGQGQSAPPQTLDPSLYPHDVVTLQNDINTLRKRLQDLKDEGKHNDRERRSELRYLEKQRLNSQINLMKLGKMAQKHISFWEYCRIVRTTFRATTPLAIKNHEHSSMSMSTQASTSTSTAIVRQSSAVHYTIFAFYEAYLLKKLHIAMMLKCCPGSVWTTANYTTPGQYDI